MTDKIKIKLSTEEICVIAGLIGYKSVIGIENEMISKWKSSLRYRIKTIVKRLEKKRILRCGLEGKLLVSENVRFAVECLCRPDIILRITDTSKKANDVKRYIMQKDGRYCLLRKSANKSCSIQISDVFDFEILKKGNTTNFQNIDVSYQTDRIRKVKNALDSFDEERARMLLTDDSECPQPVYALLELFGNDYILLDVFILTGCIYKKIFSCNIGFCDDTAVEIASDSNDIVYFKTADVTEIENTLCNIFASKECGFD